MHLAYTYLTPNLHLPSTYPSHAIHLPYILQIRYKLARYDNTTARSYVVPDPVASGHTLTGLIVWTEYDIAVASYNEAGIGEYSTFMSRKTAQGYWAVVL